MRAFIAFVKVEDADREYVERIKKTVSPIANDPGSEAKEFDDLVGAMDFLENKNPEDLKVLVFFNYRFLHHLGPTKSMHLDWKIFHISNRIPQDEVFVMPKPIFNEYFFLKILLAKGE